MYEGEIEKIKSIMKEQGPDTEAILVPDGSIIVWQHRGSRYEKILINSVPIDKASEDDIKEVRKYLGIESAYAKDYLSPEQNPAILAPASDNERNERVGHERKLPDDEIDYTDAQQNPAIPGL